MSCFVVIDSGKRVRDSAAIVEHLGRKALAGVASLKDVEFTDSVIEEDIADTGTRSCPGMTFPIQSQQNYERFYIRLYRSGLYPDTLQYTPVINGVVGWQLYSGLGFTAIADIPCNEWFHLKMEISVTRANVRG